MKLAKILFFVNGVAPTPEQLAEALELNANVMFRNATQVSDEPHSLETCDGVMGDVPPLYEEAFPTAEEAIEAHGQALKKLSDSVGDEPAPKPLTKKQLAAAKAADDKAKALQAGQQSTGGTTAPAWTGGGTGPATGTDGAQS